MDKMEFVVKDGLKKEEKFQVNVDEWFWEMKQKQKSKSIKFGSLSDLDNEHVKIGSRRN